jgi:outer membrane receptor for ferrienterochelin and colicin
VSGKVLSAEDGEPIIGATVMVKGTTAGTITDVSGNFSINVSGSNKTLVISYVGMKTTEVQATPNVIVRMESETESLDEVLVVAYGTTRREAKTGSVSSVSASDISAAPVVSVDKALSGKLAGVSITSSSGQPGAGSDICIRGTSSINAGNNPLWVVDGIL